MAKKKTPAKVSKETPRRRVVKKEPVKVATPVKKEPEVKVEPKPIPKPPTPRPVVVLPVLKRATNLNSLESEFYDKVIKAISNNPDSFSARSNNGFEIEDVVRDTQNVVYIKLDGTIVKPYELNLTMEERQQLAKAITTVVERNKQEILKLIINKK